MADEMTKQEVRTGCAKNPKVREVDPLSSAHVVDMDNYTFIRQEEAAWRNRREKR